MEQVDLLPEVFYNLAEAGGCPLLGSSSAQTSLALVSESLSSHWSFLQPWLLLLPPAERQDLSSW